MCVRYRYISYWNFALPYFAHRAQSSRLIYILPSITCTSLYLFFITLKLFEVYRQTQTTTFNLAEICRKLNQISDINKKLFLTDDLLQFTLRNITTGGLRLTLLPCLYLIN